MPSFQTGVAKLPRVARARSAHALNRALATVEEATGDGGPAPLRHAPLLIVGAPRSGSTLLFQLLVARFDVGYFTNRDCRLYGAPSLARRLTRPEPAAESFVSSHGRTEGADAPSECGEFWYRFFRRRPQYVPLAEAEPHRLRALRAAVRAFGAACERPIVYKNLLCSLRLGPIAEALPEALFLFIRRDLVANAHSLLEARRRVNGDYAAWWSAEPPGIDELRTLPAHEQVVEQVRRTEALIARDRAAIDPERFHELHYEALCDDTHTALDGIARFAAGHGVALGVRAPVPRRFERREGVRIDEELQRQLEAYAAVAVDGG